jgi:hypothetical protein
MGADLRATAGPHPEGVMSVHEKLRRERKIRALMNALDRNLAECGLKPYADGEGIAAAISLWTPAEWIALAEAIEVRPPSQETVDEVIKAYRNRAKELAS